MFHIEDVSNRKGLSDLKVDGILNASSLPTLVKIIETKLSLGQAVRLRLGGIIHCDRTGIHFLRQYQDKVTLDGLSEFLKIQIRAKSNPEELIQVKEK